MKKSSSQTKILILFFTGLFLSCQTTVKHQIKKKNSAKTVVKTDVDSSSNAFSKKDSITSIETVLKEEPKKTEDMKKIPSIEKKIIRIEHGTKNQSALDSIKKAKNNLKK